MILIVDSGSTKTEWIFLDGERIENRVLTMGFNPNYSDMQTFEDMVVGMVETCHGASLQNGIQSIHYYGTGCGTERNCLLIKEVLQRHWPEAEISVTHDLMAACHAVLGHERGIACILGTGSNACVYDGNGIVERAVSLGYLLGDEGSGMHIGREVARAYYYGFMPDDLRQKFDEAYHLPLEDFIANLYHSKQPSRYLANFAKFAGENQDHPYLRALVKNCFNAFIEAFLLRFEECHSMSIGFVGSVAFHFQGILKESLNDHGLTMGTVLQSPAEGLVRHYGR